MKCDIGAPVSSTPNPNPNPDPNPKPSPHQVLVQTILGSRFVGPMQKRVDEWDKKLKLFSDTLDEYAMPSPNPNPSPNPDPTPTLPIALTLTLTPSPSPSLSPLHPSPSPSPLHPHPHLTRWLNVQRAWMYLESIFKAADIQRQLPNEYKQFDQVNN